MSLQKKNDKISKKLPHISLRECNDNVCTCYCSAHDIEFTALFSNLIRSKGCNICSKESYSINRTTPISDFIKKSSIIHNNTYDYSNVSYKSIHDKVDIICPKHGSFKQKAYSHLSGIGCPKCGTESASNKTRYSFDKWVSILSKIHNNQYTYYDEYVDGKMKINCVVHGVFYQSPSIHKMGHGCPDCGVEKNPSCKPKDTMTVIDDFINKHGDTYDYSNINYISAKQKVEILCKKHGPFHQTPNDHLSGYGCPSCGKINSKAESEIISYLEEMGVEVEKSNRTILQGKEIDIYLPKFKLGIEYNGVYWHSYNKKETSNEIFYHLNKTKLASDNGIRLIHINEDEWIHSKDIVKSMLSHLVMNSVNRIYARKTNIVELTSKEYNTFCKQNHIQGERNASIRIGLKYEGDIVACMGFSKHPNYDYELIRYCQKLNSNVIGATSKLFKYFFNNYSFKTLLSYCDRRWSQGKSYIDNGFKLIKETKPNYRYVYGNKTFSRQSFQKHLQHKKLDMFDKELSEADNMFNNGYRRMWDCGNYKFLYVDNNSKYDIIVYGI